LVEFSFFFSLLLIWKKKNGRMSVGFEDDHREFLPAALYLLQRTIGSRVCYTLSLLQGTHEVALVIIIALTRLVHVTSCNCVPQLSAHAV
jgi:hypothetical protein